MKRWLAIILALTMLFALAACGGGSAKPSDPEPEEVNEPEGGAEGAAEGAAEAANAQETLTGVPAATRFDADFVIDLPAGYHYDEGWCCYINDQNVHIWANDMDLYEYDHNFNDVLQDYGVKGEGTPLGAYRYWTREEPTGQFYGPMMHYYVAFEGRYDDYYGCHIFATVEEGQDLKLTQAQEIVDMLKTIRRAGEPILDAPAAPPAPAATPEPTPEPTPTPEPEPTTPFSELFFNYSGEEAAAMSSFMNCGRYAAQGDALVGLGFDTNGTSLLVRMDLKRNGDFADVDAYEILDTAAAAYVSIWGDYVYYLRDWSTVCRVPLAGGTVECVVPHNSDYLQIRGDHLYYCNADYRFCRADMAGRGEEVVLDKEIYFPYLLDEDWLLYQDDADGESLHLYHIPTGEDAKMCDAVIYAPILWNTDIIAGAYIGGLKYLAKIDLINPQIDYDKSAGAFTYSFPCEIGTNPVNADVCITADGWVYTGSENATYIDDWDKAINESGDTEVFYPYAGPDWEVYWRMSDGVIDAIFITNRAGGGSQSIPLFS